MARYETAQQCIFQTALECGLTALGPSPGVNAYSSTDQGIVQMVGLLNSCGREIVTMREWQRLIVAFTMTVQIGDTGFYNLPADYSRHVDQTDWNPSNRLPLGGPLTAQDYTYLLATNLASSTIYISFREKDGQFVILPQPPPVGQVITFEYNSRYWVAAAGLPLVLAKDAPTAPDDIILFDPLLIQKCLKIRFKEAKGFDTTAASQQFNNAVMSFSGQDKSAPVLSAARSRGFPYIDDRNVPETNYGLP
jgi:hypothetical protein